MVLLGSAAVQHGRSQVKRKITAADVLSLCFLSSQVAKPYPQDKALSLQK